MPPMPPSAKPRVLLLSAGSGVGRGIIRALEMTGTRARYVLIGVNSDPHVAALYGCDTVHLIPEARPGAAHLERLRGILRAERPDIAFTGRDRDLEDFAVLRAEPEFAGTVFLSPDAAAVRIVHNKYESWRFAAAHGLPFLETAATREELAALVARVGFPLIAKPPEGYGSRSVYVIANADEAARAQASGDLVFQEFVRPPANLADRLPRIDRGTPLCHDYIEDDKLSGQGLVGRDGRLIAFTTTAQVLRNGYGIREWRVDEPEYEAIAAAYVEALRPLGYVGPFNMQCKKRGPGDYAIYELSGRFTGATTARTALGYPEVDLALEHFLHGAAPARAAIPAMIADRPQEPRLIARADLDRLLQDGVWHRGV